VCQEKSILLVVVGWQSLLPPRIRARRQAADFGAGLGSGFRVCFEVPDFVLHVVQLLPLGLYFTGLGL